MKNIILAAALCATAAHAEFMDGNKLYSDMNGSGMKQMAVIGYIMGVSDTLHGVTVCPPANASAGQMHDMVRRFLEDNPDMRHNSGDLIVTAVLRRAWPCKQQQRGNGT